MKRWLTRPRGRALMAAAIATTAIAITAPHVITGGGAPAGTANLWIDTTGGTCARQGTAGAYSDAGACSSLATAWGAAQPGDTVRIKVGAYGSQSLPTDADHGSSATLTTFRAAAGESVSLDDLVVDGANGVLVADMQIGETDPSVGSPDIRSGNNITLDNIDVTSSGQIIGGSNVTISNSDIGPYSPPSCPGSGFKIDGAQNVTMTGNYTHEFEVGGCSPPNDHLDCWHIYENLTGTLTIQGNHFEDCENYGILYGSNQTAASENALFENNWFGSVDTGATCGFALRGGAEESFQDVTVQFNSGTSCVSPQTTSTLSNVIWRGNLVSNVGGACRSGITYSYNKQTDTSGATTCGTGDATGVTASFVSSTDLHLQAGASSIDAAGATCPSMDYDGDTRPQGSACDAGADEAG